MVLPTGIGRCSARNVCLVLPDPGAPATAGSANNSISTAPRAVPIQPGFSMRFATRLILLVSILFPVFAGRAHAQTGDETTETDGVVIDEKVRWTPEQMLEAIRRREMGLEEPAGGGVEGAGVESSGSAAGGREGIVSGDIAVESEVHAAINPRDSNNIVVSPIRIGPAADGLLCPVYYTKDFGRTWNKSTFKTIPKGLDVLVNGGGDPMLAFDDDGVAYLVWIAIYFKGTRTDTSHYGLYWAYSTDGGATWQQSDSDAVAYTKYGSRSRHEIYDKEWLAVDRTDGPRRNALYLAFMQSGGSFSRPRIVVRRRLPGSIGFEQKSVSISDPNFYLVQFVSADTDPDGHVHVTWFGGATQGVNSMWHAVSTDGAATFTVPRKISDVHHPRFSTGSSYTTIPGITSRLYPCPAFAVDRSNTGTRGNLYQVWTADGITSELGHGLDIYFSRSTDHGATWSAPMVVNKDMRDVFSHQHYPSISVNPDGVVVVSWYDRRGDLTNRNARYGVAYSFDGGRTFTDFIPAAEQPTDFGSVGERNNGFGIGEYTQVLTTRGHAIPVWTDGRSSNGDLNIYAAFIPLGGDVVGVDRVTSIAGSVTMNDPVLHDGQVDVGFSLRRTTRVALGLFDNQGRRVRTLADGEYAEGEYLVSADLTGLPSGRYYLHLESGAGRAVRAVTLVR